MLYQFLKDMKIICEALISICDYECCDYGFGYACELAEKYIKLIEELKG